MERDFSRVLTVDKNEKNGEKKINECESTNYSIFASHFSSPDFVESLTDSIWFLKILRLFLSPSNKAYTK